MAGIGKVELDIRVRLNNWSDETNEILAKIETPQGEIIENKSIAEFDEEHINIEIKNPMLWWPNRFGEHPLYKMLK